MSVASGTQANLATWTIDPIHSSVTIGVRHLTVSTWTARVGPISGTIQFDGTNPESASVEASIDITTLRTGLDMFDGHLHSADFFDSERYPTITFRSTDATAAGDGRYRLRGDLTIREVTRPVDLDMTYGGNVIHPVDSRPRAGFTAQTTLNRADFGITLNPLMEGGSPIIGEKVDVTLHIEAVG
jgi:polyisoprenoid-binding protein YceI